LLGGKKRRFNNDFSLGSIHQLRKGVTHCISLTASSTSPNTVTEPQAQTNKVLKIRITYASCG
jgi:hypothetical protein